MGNKHIHFIGIGGASLNGIAQVLAARGYLVSGSDMVESAVTQHLRSLGINVMIGQKAENITPDITEVIISSAVVNGPGAVEVEAASKLKIPVRKRTIWWQRLMGEAKQAVAVAGTHGKTSTTAMLGHILKEAGLNPTVLVGGDVPDLGGTVLVGGSDYIVVEADEYDRAFYACRPTISIITNIDYDHPDTYPTQNSYIQAFIRFARLVKKRHGRVIAWGDDRTLRARLKSWSPACKWYSTRTIWPGLKVPQPGEHMRLNAQAAAHAAHELGVKTEVIKKALATFRGVSRRFEYLGQFKGVPVYDDFAHHPTEMEATLKAAKTLTDKKIAVLFQPHQRIRTKLFSKEFAEVLDQADKVGVLPLYQVAGREITEDINSDEIVRQAHTSILIEPGKIDKFLEELNISEFGVIIAMGAGDISQQIRKIVSHGD